MKKLIDVIVVVGLLAGVVARAEDVANFDTVKATQIELGGVKTNVWPSGGSGVAQDLQGVLNEGNTASGVSATLSNGVFQAVLADGTRAGYFADGEANYHHAYLADGTQAGYFYDGIRNVYLANGTQGVRVEDGNFVAYLTDDGNAAVYGQNGVYIGSLGSQYPAAGWFFDGTRSLALCDGTYAIDVGVGVTRLLQALTTYDATTGTEIVNYRTMTNYIGANAVAATIEGVGTGHLLYYDGTVWRNSGTSPMGNGDLYYWNGTGVGIISANWDNGDVLVFTNGGWTDLALGSLGDNLGNHTATQDLDMASHNITGVRLVGEYLSGPNPWIDLYTGDGGAGLWYGTDRSLAWYGTQAEMFGVWTLTNVADAVDEVVNYQSLTNYVASNVPGLSEVVAAGNSAGGDIDLIGSRILSSGDARVSVDDSALMGGGNTYLYWAGRLLTNGVWTMPYAATAGAELVNYSTATNLISALGGDVYLASNQTFTGENILTGTTTFSNSVDMSGFALNFNVAQDMYVKEEAGGYDLEVGLPTDGVLRALGGVWAKIDGGGGIGIGDGDAGIPDARFYFDGTDAYLDAEDHQVGVASLNFSDFAGYSFDNQVTTTYDAAAGTEVVNYQTMTNYVTPLLAGVVSGGSFQIAWNGPTSTVYVVSADGSITNKIGDFYGL